MTKNEKDALLDYMEFHLVSLCEQMIPHLTPEAVGKMYNVAYDVLDDLDDTIIPTSAQKTNS